MVVRLMGDSTSYQKMLKEAEQATKEAEEKLRQSSREIEKFGAGVQGWGDKVRGTVLSLAALAGITLGIGTAFKSLQLAGQAEQLQISFEVMLKSGEKAKDLIRDLKKFADLTPFEPMETISASKQLLNANVALKDIIPTMTMLGDVASGTGKRLEDIVWLFAQTKSENRVFAHDLNQYTTRGIPIIKELAKQLGVAEDQVRHMASSGKINFDNIEKAFKSMTSAGGQYTGMMDKQSQSFDGLMSTLKGYIDSTLQSFGEFLIVSLGMKKVINDLASAAQGAAAFLNGMDKETKQIIGSILGTIVVVGSLIAAITLLSAVASVMWTLFLGPAAPLVYALIAATGLIALIINELGGVASAWEYVKQKTQEFWNWIKPIRQALYSLYEFISIQLAMAWDKVKEAFRNAMAWIKEHFGVDWDSIRDAIRDGILMIEFVLGNLGKVWEVVWAGMKYLAIAALNAVLENVFLIMGGPLVLAALASMAVNWEELFSGMGVTVMNTVDYLMSIFFNFSMWFGQMFAGMSALWNPNSGSASTLGIIGIYWKSFWDGLMDYTTQIFASLGVEAAEFALALKAAMGGNPFAMLQYQADAASRALERVKLTIDYGMEGAGLDADTKGNVKKTIEDIEKAAKEAIGGGILEMAKTKFNFKGITNQTLKDLEEQLKKEFEDKKGALGESWQEFHKRKMEEFAKGPAEEIANKAQDTGANIGKKMTAGLTHELHKFDAALYGSAEAVTRAEHYLDTMRAGQTSLAIGGPDGGGGMAVGNKFGFGAKVGTWQDNPNAARAVVPFTNAGTKPEKLEDILNKIEQNTKKLSDKDEVALLPADF